MGDRKERKARASTGALVGGLFGLAIGMIIPSDGNITRSFLGRVTQDLILNDPPGFFLGLVNILAAIVICGLIGGVIGSIPNHNKSRGYPESE